jgi:O-antigen/teichoic acid export membrane protein
MPTTDASQTAAPPPGAQEAVSPSSSSMKSVFGPMLRHGTMYSVAIAAGKFSSFLLLPVYTRYLTPTDYGIMELLDLTCFVAASLLSVRLADSMLYHYFASSKQEVREAILSTAFLGSALLGCVAAALGWLAAPLVSQLVFSSAKYIHYFRLVFLAVGFSLPQSVGYTYLRAQNRSSLFCAVSIGRLLFQVALVLSLLIVCRMGFAALVWTSLVTYALEALCACWYVLRGIQLSFDFRLFRKLAAYGAPLVIGSLGMLVLHFGDRYFLQHYVSLAQIGIYALAYKLGMLVAHAQTPFTQYWSAQMFPIMRRADGGKAYVRVVTYYVVASLFIGLALALFSRPLLVMMATPRYYGAASFVPVIALAYVLRGLGDLLRTVFFVEKRTAVDGLITTFGAVVCLVLYAILIPRMGVWGAAMATLGAFAAMVPVSLWRAQRLRRFAFEWKRLTVASLCCGGLYLAGKLGLALELGPAVMVAGAGTLLFPLILLLAGFFNESEKAFARQAWRQRLTLPVSKSLGFS